MRFALVGNPNCGKTTLFNKLTGGSQRVGNWPGVTIERVEGRHRATDSTIVDLPGIYSLSPFTPEENVTRDFLLEDKPDVIIDVVDASNIERNLYLTMQILDMGIPTVIALNMIDVTEKRNIVINAEKLSSLLGCPVIKTSATKNIGLEELMKAATSERDIPNAIELSAGIESAIKKATDAVKDDGIDANLRWSAIKLLERDERTVASLPNVWNKVKDSVEMLEKESDDTSDSIIAGARYDAIEKIVASVVKRPKDEKTISDSIDKIVTNRLLGLPIFAAIMLGVYYVSMTTIGGYLTDWVNDVFFGEWVIPGAREWLAGMEVDPALIGLVVDGIISGVGAVLGFLPQVLVLFVFLVILEDCGYMARVCFVLDRLFRKFNLSGKSVIPLMVGTGCGVPGIMASRGIENESDRRLTVMTTTFIPCSAKLPIIALIAGALFNNSALVAVFAYVLGIGCVLISGIILKKWKAFAGAPSVFMMELPPYHLPSILTTVMTTLERGWAFVKKAGTFILVACAIVWFLSSFSWNITMVEDINDSMLAGIGNAINWVFIPLGWGNDWEFSVATITGLLAKENVVGTFGVLFGFSEVSESGEEIWTIIASLLTPVAALSFLTFNLVCAPCFAAIGAMRRELGTWKLTGLAVAFQCVLAYAVAMMVYQFGMLAVYGTVGWGLAVATIVLIGMIAIMVSKDPFGSISKGDDVSC